jgi:hypothetical protein
MCKALKHVLYEIDMFRNQPSPTISNSIYENNAFWESRFVHLRNLIDFFSCNGSDDTLIVTDIIKDFKRENNLRYSYYTGNTRTNKQQPALKAINWAINHISKYRFEINDIIKDFLDEHGNICHGKIDDFYINNLKINEIIDMFLDRVLAQDEYKEYHNKAKSLKSNKESFTPKGVTTTCDKPVTVISILFSCNSSET